MELFLALAVIGAIAWQGVKSIDRAGNYWRSMEHTPLGRMDAFINRVLGS